MNPIKFLYKQYGLKGIHNYNACLQILTKNKLHERILKKSPNLSSTKLSTSLVSTEVETTTKITSPKIPFRSSAPMPHGHQDLNTQQASKFKLFFVGNKIAHMPFTMNIILGQQLRCLIWILMCKIITNRKCPVSIVV